jgi:Domain of unknown function (DUF4287)
MERLGEGQLCRFGPYWMASGEHVTMAEQAPPWPKQGPASYFPSIEKKYGRSIAEWQQIIAGWSAPP